MLNHIFRINPHIFRKKMKFYWFFPARLIQLTNRNPACMGNNKIDHGIVANTQTLYSE